MPKSTRRGPFGRADVIEMFSPRRSGPWHLLGFLHSRYGLLALAILTLIGYLYFRYQGHPTWAIAVVVTAVVLWLLSFKFLWELTGLLIRSRAELTIGTGGILADVLFRAWLGAFATIALLALLGALTALPATRRYLLARCWCVIDRHRLRLCLRQTKVRTMNMDGSLPLLLWARPTKTGERVWVWTRAGASGDDIEDAVDYIASACYARESRVTTNRRITTLVTIDIIRRDPLSKATIMSALAKFLPLGGGTDTSEGTDPLTAISVTEITNTRVNPEDIVPTNGKTKASKVSHKAALTVDAPAVVPAPTTGTADFSDYIDN